ncbi:hypothetical protein LMG27198_42770 [Methylocystis echinoides]|jgi:hypothetical protein|uniref:Uncharacterized protein n=2 Tax=Methylocystis echinoides TaxID=29468 RepID=A0A9W6LU01_9HYPH|nr:hypothetical protein LMG27198_42770 [Methylocystis echinoides]
MDTSRTVIREAARTAADEQARAHAALEAQRALAAHSTAPLAASLAVDARLEALRCEQMEKLRQISGEKEAGGKATESEIGQ